VSRGFLQPIPGDGRSSNSALVPNVPASIREAMSFISYTTVGGIEDATRYLNMRRERA